MKSQTVLDALHKQASQALTGFPDSNGRFLNTFGESLSVLLCVESLTRAVFGCCSPEAEEIELYLKSFDGKLFVGPMPHLAVSRGL